MDESIKLNGVLEQVTEWKDGHVEVCEYKNKVLDKGRQALARTLAGDLDSEFSFYISRMLFGDGGTQGGVKKYMYANRNGLFGTTRLAKPVIANINNSVPEQVIVTCVIRFDELVGVTINEMATQLGNGDIYSMVTFPDVNKTADMQITYNWKFSFV